MSQQRIFQRHRGSGRWLLMASLLFGTMGMNGGCPFLDSLAGFPGGTTGDDNDGSDNDNTDSETCKCDRAVQVTIETKFLVAEDNFLEDIGVDLDITLPPEDSSGSGASYEPGTLNVGGVSAFTSAVNGNQPSALSVLDPPATDPGLSLSFAATILDGNRVDLVLAAAQNDQRVSTLSAPQVVATGNQSAFIMVNNEARPVNDLQPDFVNALNAIDPLIDPFTTGPAIEITVRGLQDETFIVLGVRPSDGGTFNTPDVTGDRLMVRTSTAETTMMVRDGETVVLGGLVDTNGTQTEGLVPLVGDVPIIGRAFENRQTVNDQTTLVIFVTPRIMQPVE